MTNTAASSVAVVREPPAQSEKPDLIRANQSGFFAFPVARCSRRAVSLGIAVVPHSKNRLCIAALLAP
jgi:hypothetical protein